MAQKIEVITSVARRRRFSMDEKARIVAETLELGASVASVARRYEISPSLLFAWRRQAAVKPNEESDCRPVPGIAADIVRQIEVELAACRRSLPPGRRRIRASPRLRELVTLALGSGLTPSRVASLTGLPRTTVKSWRKAKDMAQLQALPAAPRELSLVNAVAPIPSKDPEPCSILPASHSNARVHIGTSVTIELPVAALTDSLLRALLAAGGE